MVTHERVELNCEYVGNQIAKPPITNLEDNNTHIEETDYYESSNGEGEGTQMQKDGAHSKNENITETRGRSKERKKGKRQIKNKDMANSPSLRIEQAQKRSPQIIDETTEHPPCYSQ